MLTLGWIGSASWKKKLAIISFGIRTSVSRRNSQNIRFSRKSLSPEAASPVVVVSFLFFEFGNAPIRASFFVYVYAHFFSIWILFVSGAGEMARLR